METLGDRLKFARKVRGLTQADVAANFNIARVSVTNWESGKTKPEIEKIPALAEIYQTSVDWLLEAKGDPPSKQVKSAPSAADIPITSELEEEYLSRLRKADPKVRESVLTLLGLRS